MCQAEARQCSDDRQSNSELDRGGSGWVNQGHTMSRDAVQDKATEDGGIMTTVNSDRTEWGQTGERMGEPGSHHGRSAVQRKSAQQRLGTNEARQHWNETSPQERWL